jgi:hypothetical protein
MDTLCVFRTPVIFRVFLGLLHLGKDSFYPGNGNLFNSRFLLGCDIYRQSLNFQFWSKNKHTMLGLKFKTKMSLIVDLFQSWRLRGMT